MTTPRELLAQYATQSQMSSFFIDRMGIINVKSYGATGDGTTDDTTFIQNAFNALTAGGTIHFPPGTYKVTSALTLPDVHRGRIWGYGATLQTTATSGNIIQNNLTTLTNQDGWKIEGLYLDGNTKQVTGIYNQGWKRNIIRNVYFYKCKEGVSLYNDCYYNQLDNNKYRECTTGVKLTGASAIDSVWPNSSEITGGSFELCGTSIDIPRCNNLKINTSIEGSTVTGISFGANATGCKVITTRFESNAIDLTFVSGETENSFIGNEYYNTTIKVSGTPSVRDTFLEGYQFNTLAWVISSDALLKMGAGSYKSTKGVGLHTTAALEWLNDSGSGYGIKHGMDATQAHYEMYTRYNSASWLRVLMITTNNNNFRIGDATDPDASGGAKLAAASLGVDVLTAAPSSPRNGMIVYADGTNWNPGSGAGFYGYQAGAWVKL